MTSAARQDFEDISSVLAAGDIVALEDVAGRLDDFPTGRDGFIGRHWITNAIDLGTRETVLWMIANGAPLRFRDAEGYTVLHSALDRPGHDRHQMITDLLAAGADVNAYGVNDWTPLHLAGMRADLRAIRTLIDAGADRSLRTRINDCLTPEEETRNPGRADAADLIRDYEPGQGRSD